MKFPESLNLKNRPVLIGMTLYVVSFFLVAVHQQGHGGNSALGFMCAHTLLLYPWVAAKTALQSESSFVHYMSGTVSGLINPVFWLFLKPVGAIRTALFFMMPACWFVFYQENLYPREGYFLWTAGMLLVLPTTRLPAQPSNQVSLTLELHR
jgi:hypothetical protein